MKYLSLIIAVLCCLNVSLALSVDEPAFLKTWDEFKEKFGKKYDTYEEELRRLEIFKKNVKLIEQHNSEAAEYVPKHTYTLRLNEFGDWTQDEFSDMDLGTVISPPTLEEPKYSYYRSKRQSVPDSFDWRQNGFNTPPKDQNPCSSCWVFSAVGALEAQLAKKGQKVSLSEQQILDCAGVGKCRNTGDPNNALNFIKKNGLSSDTSYPYEQDPDQTCQTGKLDNGISPNRIIQIKRVNNENTLKVAIATDGPVIVAVNFKAGSGVFRQQFHGNGFVGEDLCGPVSSGPTHAMLVVGYGTDNQNGDYWIVKNSYGTGWGEGGYIRMARNKNNFCGIASHAMIPLIS